MAKIDFRIVGTIGVLIFLKCVAWAGEDRLPPPSKTVAASLPQQSAPVRYDFALCKGGGFTVAVNDTCYPVESSYSFPHGGENRLTAGELHTEGEPTWRVECRKLDDKNFEVAASGKFYSINRRITLHSNRIEVSDTFRNKTAAVLGIILSNQINAAGKPVSSVLTPGNYTLFVAAADHGLAMVGLDDLYQLQQKTSYRDNAASMSTDKFGLDGGASYTIQWALYPTATGDYFEFVNAFRKTEDVDRTVEGAFYLAGDGEGLVTAADRRRPADPKEVQAKGIKYYSLFYLIAPADDPGMSPDGFEFVEYPRECALLKKTIAESHRLNPGLKVMFHVAHGLYACNNPAERFPDSRVIRADGRQIMYGGNDRNYYQQYFSKERVDEGYRWYIFYPTLENSFGKAMLKAMDYMLEEIGASGLYADGFVDGYGYVDGNDGGYTHDRWDGHSVEIDAKTKLVTRKLGNVALMSLPVLKAVCRKVASKGGMVITNGKPGPRSLWKENYITTCETGGGGAKNISLLYVGPAITAFGDPLRIKSRRDLYEDVLNKLACGALYFYYGDKNYSVEKPMLVRHMYPFTREETHAGWMKGKERIITTKPGSYGWRGNKRLHKVYRSDAEGFLVANADFSTVDAAGTRTELRLAERESAVIEKIPVTLETDAPVNCLVEQYDAKGVKILLHGEDDVRLTLRGGVFPIRPDKTYRVVWGDEHSVNADDEGILTIALHLSGATIVSILPVED